MSVILNREYSNAIVETNFRLDGIHLPNVLVSIYCNLVAQDDLNKMIIGDQIEFLMPTNAESFKLYDSLTYDVVDSWVLETSQYQILEQKIVQMLNNARTISLEPKPLPFAPIEDVTNVDASSN